MVIIMAVMLMVVKFVAVTVMMMSFMIMVVFVFSSEVFYMIGVFYLDAFMITIQSSHNC